MTCLSWHVPCFVMVNPWLLLLPSVWNSPSTWLQVGAARHPVRSGPNATASLNCLPTLCFSPGRPLPLPLFLLFPTGPPVLEAGSRLLLLRVFIAAYVAGALQILAELWNRGNLKHGVGWRGRGVHCLVGASGVEGM